MGSETSPSLRCQLLTEIIIPSARVYKFKTEKGQKKIAYCTSLYLASAFELFPILYFLDFYVEPFLLQELLGILFF